MLTRDTEARCTRGSFISVSIREESSWRSCSAIRSGRGGREDGLSTGWNRDAAGSPERPLLLA
jgi:hypothetical protein